MSDNTAKSPNGGSRKEIAKRKVSEGEIPTIKVSQERIDSDIAAFTGNPETTIVVCSIDAAFLKESKPIKGDSSEYADFGEERKKSLQDLEKEQDKPLIISAHTNKAKAKTTKARKENRDVEEKKEENREEDREN